MLNTKSVFALALVICSGLAAQNRQATISHTLGNSQIRSSVDLLAQASFTISRSQTEASNYLTNSAEFAIGAPSEIGIQVVSMSNGWRYSNGAFAIGNWNGVRRGNVWILSTNLGNETYNKGVSAGTVTDRSRSYTVGSYTVAAKIRISAGAAINLEHTSFSNTWGQAAYLTGSTRTYMDGSVWAVVGQSGATARMSSTLDMHDTTMNVDLSAGAVTTGGTMSYSIKSAKLYMSLRARRYSWQSWARNLLVNSYTSATSGSRNLL